MSVNDDTSVFEQHQLQQDDDGIMFVESNVLANPLDQQQYEYQYQYEQQEPVDGTYEYAVMEQPMEALTFEEESVSPNPVDQEMSNENPIEEQPVEQVPPEKPKGATKRKSDPNGKSFCETFVDKSMATPQQLKAIECLGTERGMIQMNIWLNAAIEENDIPRLCVLLAQCYHAEITLTLLSAGSAPKTVRGLRKFANKDVQRAASEVYQKWFAIVESNVKKTSTEKSIAKAAVKRPALPKGVGIASNSLDLLDAEDEPTPSASPSKRVSLKARPKTARTRQTKFRLTGFEEDADTQDAPVTMPVKTLTQKAGAVSSRPTTNAIATPPAPAVVSDAFANALAASSTGPPPPKVVRKTPPVINRPPVIPAPSMGELNSSASSRESLFTSPVDKLKHFNGPDRSRVPLPGQPRRIHFADDFEDPRPLVAIKYIPPRERICVSANQSQRDMQHADAESERRSLEKSKLEQLVEDDDEEQQQQQQPPPVEPETPMPPKKRLLSKNIVRKIQTVLYKEEEDRKSRTMSYFALKGIIRDMPSAPDKVTPYAYTSDFNEMIKIYCTSKKPNEEDVSGSIDDIAAAVQPVEDVKSVIEPIQIDESPASPPPETKPEPQIALIENFDIHSAHASANTAKKNPSVSLLTPDLKNILNNLRQSETIKKALASASGAGPSTPTARPPPPSVPSGSIDIVEVPIDIHSGGPPVPIPMPPVMIPGPRPQFRGPVPPFGGGFRPRLPLTPCRFFFQGRCTKGVHCPFAHNGPPQPIAPVPPPQRHPVSRGFEPVNDDFHRGRDQYRSRGRGDRYTRRRSPSPLRERRRRRSDSRSPERDDRRHRRRRSPSSDRYYRDSPRSPSRSPIPSRSRSPSPRYPDR